VENHTGLKLKFYQNGDGEVIVDHVVPLQYQGYPGIVHGGIVASMLDEVAGRTMMGDPRQPRFMFTASLNIQYRKPVPVGQPIRLVGRATKVKERSAYASAYLYGPQGDLLAEAEAVLVNVPEAMLAGVDLEALGWKVYPDPVEQEARP
jgi:uncharacterized protein (TIGR00369 family)